MKRIIISVLALGVCLTPLTVPLMVQPSWGQSQDSRVEELRQLIRQAFQQKQQGQPRQAIETFQQAFTIARELLDGNKAIIILLGIGSSYHQLSQYHQALDYHNQALSIARQIKDRFGEAAALNNIGSVSDSIGKPQEALQYYNQALSIMQELKNRAGEANILNNIGAVYKSIGQPQEALKYINQALPIIQEVGDRAGEASLLNGLGTVYGSIGQPQEALKYYNKALLITREVRAHGEEANTLGNMGAAYGEMSQPQEALNYFNQALLIWQEIGNRSRESATLRNMGAVYDRIGQPQEALKYYNKALSISRNVGDRTGESATLSNIGIVYRDTKQPTQAIENWQQSVQITLEIRAGLQQENRQKFLESQGVTAIALTDLLIDQNQPERAFQWVNLATTADLADYTRLINAKVKNPEAQKLIDQWNQRSQQIQFLSRQLQEKFSDQLSQQINQLHEDNSKLAEKIRRDFPEVAELFETTPQDITQLRSSIPPDTVVIQPVLLTNVTNVPNTVALFVLTKDQISVVKIPINPAEFDKLLTEHDRQLHGSCNQKACDGNSNYDETGSQLYDILIRPIEDKIKVFSPKQLSIIATGKLRYIPFETLYDKQTEKFLIEKYPINYLTRISTRTIPDSTLQGGILALGNPVPRAPQNLPGTEAEVKTITQFLPGSIAYINNNATLTQFKTQAPRFPFLHLATHGCFQSGGCKNLGMNEGTLLFADSTLNIADAALLGLENTRLLTLSACQTALQANSNGEEISGIAYIFERAGARAVMATLWSVNDEETKELMIEFYRNINKGMSKVEALREAKISLIKTKPHPFFWSTFILIGDGR